MVSRFNIVEEIFRRKPHGAPAICQDGKTWTYGDLDALSQSTADSLSDMFRDGRCPRIGLCCPDGAVYIGLALGIMRAGGCLVPIAQEWTPSERSDVERGMGTDGVLSSDGRSSVGTRIVRSEGTHPDRREADFAGLNPAFIRFSSGTTGRSKGILLSHESLLERITVANHGLQIGSGDRVLWVLSMTHHFAVSIVLYLWHGATIVLPNAPTPEGISFALASCQPSVMYAAPFHYESLVANVKTRIPHALRLAVSTTSRLQSASSSAFARTFGIFPSQSLGIIEVGLPFLNASCPNSKPDSVGTIQPSLEFRLVSGDGQPVSGGGTGELLIRGPGLLDAYVQPWRVRGEILSAGWFATGDIARVDTDGFLYLIGRKHSAITFGGMKFFPEEVEAVLCEHPAVADARVFGCPHPDTGMVPCAEIVLSDGQAGPAPKEIMTFCKERLARYKIPLQISYVTSIPKTSGGKTLRSSAVSLGMDTSP